MPSVAGEPAEPRVVVMLVYPGVVAMDIFGPLEAFATANAIAHRPLYRLAIAAMTMAPVDTSLGICITPSVAVADIREPIDTLLVSGGYGQAEASCDERLLARPEAAPPLRIDLHGRLRPRRGRPARRQARDHALGDGRGAGPALSESLGRGRPDLRARRQRLHLGRRDRRHRSGARHDRGGSRPHPGAQGGALARGPSQ